MILIGEVGAVGRIGEANDLTAHFTVVAASCAEGSLEQPFWIIKICMFKVHIINLCPRRARGVPPKGGG